MSAHLLTVHVRVELDVIASRQRARQIAERCGYTLQDQARIATAVSELARNIVNYAGTGQVRFALEEGRALAITVCDSGRGIADLELVLSGQYRSRTGMGLGLLAAKRLMERCEIDTGPHGTTIVMSKALPPAAQAMSGAAVAELVAGMGDLPNNVALSEARQQNLELAHTLDTLQNKQDQLMELAASLKQTNARIEALNHELDEKAEALMLADSRKDAFLAILSHELRGPLSAAGMAAQLLEISQGDADRPRQLGQLIARQVVHMSRLVEDLLDVSRVSRGLVVLDKTAVDLCQVVRDAVEQVMPEAGKKRHSVRVDLPPDPCVLDGDRTRLLQVVGNLLGNAIRYSPEGSAIVVTLARGGGHIQLEVRDNGQGLPAHLIPHLFDLYVQAERSADRRTSGLGLGLPLVKSLVEAHGGSVTARSEGPGMGSSFMLTFGPQATAAAPV
ncbi:MAG TPA: sensor histidine kinase [Burkholderiaceae bacterium]